MPSGTTLTPHPAPESPEPETTPQITIPRERRPIVVGVDESSGSAVAVEWAAAEARSRGVALHIVHSWTWQTLEPWSHGVDQDVIVGLKRDSREMIKTSLDLAAGSEGVTVTGESIEGYAPDVLAKKADTAGLIVVGSNHRRIVGRAVMGSVSTSLVARATCPVVVMAGPPGLPGENPSVVVGVTGTEDDERVLEFAFGYASRHGRPLRALYFWHPPFADAELPPPARAQAWLSESLAGWRERYPEVQLRSSVIREYPVHGLVAASASQELLVVGRHSRRTYLGTLLGSVSLGVLHHATCPVAVVPPE